MQWGAQSEELLCSGQFQFYKMKQRWRRMVVMVTHHDVHV